MWTKPTYTLLAWTHTHQSESATTKGECHTAPALQETTQYSAAHGHIAYHPTPPPQTKLNTIDREHNSPLPGRDRAKYGAHLWDGKGAMSQLFRVGARRITEPKLPKFVRGGADLPEPKGWWSNIAAIWWQQKCVWLPWRIW
jgi:hypothetical protein